MISTIAPPKGQTTKPTTLTREQLLAASDINHPEESRWAELKRGEGISPAKAAMIARFERKATAELRRAACQGQEPRSRDRKASQLASRVQTGHSSRRGSNSRSAGSRRGAATVSSSSSDPGDGEPSEPPRTCLQCGEALPPWKRADADFCEDTCSKAYRRAQKSLEANRPPETLWAAKELAERKAWRALASTDGPKRLFRPRLVSDEDEVDPDVLEVFLEESQGRADHNRHVLRMVAA